MIQDPLLPKHSDGAEEPTAETLSPRALQLELLAQSNEPNAFVTVRRMYQFFELQLWEVLPVITLKELMEEITEVCFTVRLGLKFSVCENSSAWSWGIFVSP